MVCVRAFCVKMSPAHILVWFDDFDISAFHSCVVVDLWQSFSEWHLLLSACVLVCRREAKKSHNLPRPLGEVRWHFLPCHHRWWNLGLSIRPWNEAANSTMEECQFPTTKKRSVSPNQESKQCCWLFLYIRGIVHYEFVPTGRTVNQVYYLEVLERLLEKVRRKLLPPWVCDLYCPTT